jgi:tetratricopeptide (TPR) repeat protein
MLKINFPNSDLLQDTLEKERHRHKSRLYEYIQRVDPKERGVENAFNEVLNLVEKSGAEAHEYVAAAKAFFQQNLFQHASHFMMKALQLDSGNHEYHYLMSAIYMSTGYRLYAVGSMKECVRLRGEQDPRWWTGKNDEELDILLVTALGVGEVILAAYQAPKVKEYIGRIGIVAKTHLIELAKLSKVFDVYMASEKPIQDSLALAAKSSNYKVARMEDLYILPNSLEIHYRKSGSFLYPPHDIIAYWKSKLSRAKTGGKVLIGLCWQGKKDSPMHPNRSFHLNDMESLLADTRNGLISLQHGFGAEQLAACRYKTNFVDCQEEINGKLTFTNTAALIMHCDYIITCDTGIAQIACALGVLTVIVTQEHPSAWWAGEGSESFLYKNAYVHKRYHNESWKSCIDRLCTAKIQKHVISQSGLLGTR